MEPVRVGIIGVGGMGSSHAKSCSESEHIDLVALCDAAATRREQLAEHYPVPVYESAEELLDKAAPEAVIIATPHYDHTPISIAALERGVHVLCEKPVGVHVRDVERMTTAYEQARGKYPDLKFGAMFQQRTLEAWKKIKSMIDGGELGNLVRATWIITTWFRTQHYYDSGTWRATWKGEGGGVLLNQCPHNLDLYQWFFGMPDSVMGTAAIGKYHHIEVEDEVTAVFEHGNGMVGHFITSTAESPGTNRLEIVGENGRLIYNDGVLTFDQNEESMLSFLETSDEGFAKVPAVSREIDVPADQGGPHATVIEAFVQSVREGTPLVAEAPEGLRSVALANGILMSHFSKTRVTFPLDGGVFATLLDGLVENSTFEKRAVEPQGEVDLSGSF